MASDDPAAKVIIDTSSNDVGVEAYRFRHAGHDIEVVAANGTCAVGRSGQT